MQTSVVSFAPLGFSLTKSDLQDTFNAASIRYRIAIGPNNGQKTQPSI